jgi:hypothetical protein
LNSRPPVPQTGALTGLRYAPPIGWKPFIYAGAVGRARAGRETTIRPRSAPGDQEVVAPMVDVDDGALAGDTQEGGVDHMIGGCQGVRTNTKRRPRTAVTSVRLR